MFKDDSSFDHVIGSAAEVEHLWLIAKYALTTTWTNLAPILFKAILFLQLNSALWDKKTVQEALLAKAKQKEERLRKKLDLAEEQAEDNDGSVEDNDENEDE